MDVVPLDVVPVLAFSTTEPAASPGLPGVVAENVNVPLAPVMPAGLRVNFDVLSVPNEAYFWVLSSKWTVPAVPPSEPDCRLKMTAVQVPAAGLMTSTLPKLPTPCGSE